MGIFGRDGNSERSAADREAARVERERRRAVREGRTPPPSPERPAAAAEPVPEPPAPPEPEPVYEAPPEPEPVHEAPPEPEAVHEAPPEPEAVYEAPPEPEPVHEAQPEPDSEPDPQPELQPDADPEPLTARRAKEPDPQATQPFSALEPAAARPAAPAGGHPGRRTVSLPRPQTDEHVLADTHGYEEPIGTVRRRRQPYTPQPGAPGFGHRPVGVPKSRRGVRRLIPLVLLVLVAAVVVFLVLLFQPLHGAGKGSVTVKVPTGATASDIGKELSNAGVVSSGFFFALRARITGQRQNLRAGTYKMRKGMSYAAALDELTTAPTAAPVVRVTLPEGPSRREFAPRVKAAGIQGDYLTATKRSSLLNPRSYGAPKSTSSLEGFLFPATYELKRSGASATTLVREQLQAFKRNFAGVNMAAAKRKNLTRYDVLTIASMIDREALVAKDRRLIAAVIYNRLKQGIPLGIDATIRYELGNFSRPLKVSELQRDSPYNTRKRKGLPPTPIGNPGLASIQAAANPANVSYLYYVVKPCGNGAHAFSSTDAQFQRDVAAYNQARAKRGGKDPSVCK
jgi:UPF0755 protein